MSGLPEGARLVKIDGGRRLMRSRGHGPGVVFISGGGVAGVGAWDAVEARMLDRARVTSFDRAGTGYSDAPPRAPSVADMVSEMDQVLTVGGIQGPQVLVGGSYAGLIQLLYASTYPGQVAGLVLLDPTRPDDRPEPEARRRALQTMRARAAAGEFSTPAGGDEIAAFFSTAFGRPVDTEKARFLLESYQQAAGWDALLLETKRRDESYSQVRDALSSRPLPDVPVLVISAGVWPTGPGMAEAIEQAHAGHRQIAQAFPRGQHRIAEGQTHWMSFEAPDYVAGLIDEVLSFLN